MSWAPAFLSNPERFMAFSRWAAPMFGVIAVLLAFAGLYLGFTAPEDYQQGQTVRIMFIHVPAAQMSMFAYVCLAIASFLALNHDAVAERLQIPRPRRPSGRLSRSWPWSQARSGADPCGAHGGSGTAG